MQAGGSIAATAMKRFPPCICMRCTTSRKSMHPQAARDVFSNRTVGEKIPTVFFLKEKRNEGEPAGFQALSSIWPQRQRLGRSNDLGAPDRWLRENHGEKIKDTIQLALWFLWWLKKIQFNTIRLKGETFDLSLFRAFVPSLSFWKRNLWNLREKGSEC